MEKEQNLINTFPHQSNDSLIHAEIFLNTLTEMILNAELTILGGCENEGKN